MTRKRGSLWLAAPSGWPLKDAGLKVSLQLYSTHTLWVTDDKGHRGEGSACGTEEFSVVFSPRSQCDDARQYLASFRPVVGVPVGLVGSDEAEARDTTASSAVSLRPWTCSGGFHTLVLNGTWNAVTVLRFSPWLFWLAWASCSCICLGYFFIDFIVFFRYISLYRQAGISASIFP